MNKIKLSAILIALCLVLTVAGACGGSKNPLVGKWAYGNTDTVWLTIKEKELSFDGENFYEYTAEDGELVIFYPTYSDRLKYSVSDNNLSIGDSFGLMSYSCHRVS